MIIGKQMEEFEGEAYFSVEKEIKTVKLSEYRGKWLVLLFYPADFTFVCPTELADLAKAYDKIKELGGEVLSISTDTAFVHKAWLETEPLLKDVRFPMLADPTGKVSRLFDVYDEGTGLALRGAFILDPEGTVKSVDITMYDVGRNIDEVVRRLKAYKYVTDNPGAACPAHWEEGDLSLNISLDMVGHVADFLKE